MHGPANRTHPSPHGYLAALTLALLVLLSACAAPTGLVPVREPEAVGFVDDGEAEPLGRAIAQSIRYYKRLPATATFTYGERTYTASEMVRSLRLFRRTHAEAADAAELSRLVAERFHVFASVREGGENLFTGYFEPELPASTEPTAELDTPLYARPPDLLEIRLREFSSSLPDRRLMGRVHRGAVVPYHSREEIQEDRALHGKAEPLAYVSRVDLFFLQIQGSGRLRFPDGRVVKVGYAGTNGRAYRSLGAEMVRRGIMPLEAVSMQSIRAWLAENPEQVPELLYTNPSYVFFQVLETEGPLGNIAVPLTPRRSLAMDHRLVPRGGLAYVDLALPTGDPDGGTEPFQRFMLVQDTGGAITGHGRADVFLGFGDEAGAVAGRLKHPGRLYLLVAKKAHLPPPTPQPAPDGAADTAEATEAPPPEPAAPPVPAASQETPEAGTEPEAATEAAGPETQPEGASEAAGGAE